MSLMKKDLIKVGCFLETELNSSLIIGYFRGIVSPCIIVHLKVTAKDSRSTKKIRGLKMK